MTTDPAPAQGVEEMLAGLIETAQAARDYLGGRPSLGPNGEDLFFEVLRIVEPLERALYKARAALTASPARSEAGETDAELARLLREVALHVEPVWALEHIEKCAARLEPRKEVVPLDSPVASVGETTRRHVTAPPAAAMSLEAPRARPSPQDAELIAELRDAAQRGYTISGKRCAADIMADAAARLSALSATTPGNI